MLSRFMRVCNHEQNECVSTRQVNLLDVPINGVISKE